MSLRSLHAIFSVGAVAGALALSGCGAPASLHGVAAARVTVRCASGYRSLDSPRRAWAAVVRRRTPAFREPGRGRLATLGTVNLNGVSMVLGVRGVLRRACAATWYRVQLPLRPNGLTGWVRARDVALARVETRLVVDVAARRVTLYRRGRAVLRAAAAVGAPATPTPTGRFYVNQRLIPSDPAGPFGPGAIGISAFSDVLTGWAQGGPIAIHGTNEPWTIGRAVSNGCIRVRNAVLRRLFAAVHAGAPVLIRR